VETALDFDIGTRGLDDATLNRALVRKYQPDTLVILTLELNSSSKTKLLFLNKTWLQAEVKIDFLAPETLQVLASRTVQTEFVEVKGHEVKFPQDLKDQLTRRLAMELPALPY
jgi:hypothetical protein